MSTILSSLQELSGESIESVHVTPISRSYDVLLIETRISSSADISLIPTFQPLARAITSVDLAAISLPYESTTNRFNVNVPASGFQLVVLMSNVVVMPWAMEN